MVKEAKRSKSENLSLRLDPKSRFVLEFVARVEARSITTIVERAIREYAGNVVVGPETDSRGNECYRPNWSDFWDPSEGVRTLKMLAQPELRTTFEEDELRSFTMAHRAFFYEDLNGKSPLRAYVEVLWPQIQNFLTIWQTQKASHYWAAGEAMKASLLAARVKAPEWPPKATPSQGYGDQKQGGDLDDDIPF